MKDQTRAARMAAQYGQKLVIAGVTKPVPREVKQSDKDTAEMRRKRETAVEKLASFKDLLGQ
jgi:hypothetical protein